MSIPTSTLQTLLQRRDIWRLQEGGRGDLRGRQGSTTGFPALDTALYEGGWPQAALTELLLDRPGVGELQLLLPALAAVARQQLWQVWINPPFTPYMPVLTRAGITPASLLIVRAEPSQQLWACEQALRCAASGAVLFWPALPLRYAELRKLQVAAGAQQSLAFLFRGSSHAVHTSPAALRLQLAANQDGLAIEVLKQRGGHAGQRVLIARSPLLSAQIPLHERSALVSAAPAERGDLPRNGRRALEPLAARQPVPGMYALRRGRHGLR